MSENITNENEEQLNQYKNSSELSSDDLNNTNAIILNEYQPFIIGDYYFVIGTTQSESLYFECKQKDKYYNLLISKNNLCILNEKFNTCKDIDEVYKLILNSINEIDITALRNNKLKFTLSAIFEETPYPFEIILKEETNKNALLLTEDKIKNENSMKDNENKSKNNGLVLIEENDENSEYKKEKSSVNEEESQDPSHKNDFYLVKYNINNNEQIKDAIKNLSGKEEENENEEEEDDEDEEGEDIERPSETTNMKNEENKIYNIINELKKEIKNLKGIITKYEQANNNEKINELELKNDNLLKEIDKMKNELKMISEDNKKNKEEINILKKNIPIGKSIKELDNSKLENTIKEIKNKTLSNSQLIKTISNIEKNHNIKNLKTIKLKKKKKQKPKSQRKSIVFSNIKNEDSLYGINEFIFKQKYKIKETDSELDLTNKKLGDKGLEELSLIKFNELKILSLDTNGIFSIKPLTNLTLNNLEVLNLDNNYISNISILEYCKFPSLQILWLNNNNIIEISVFERVKFNQLQHLYLNNNNITDISVFKKVDFNNLERLYLKNNKIEDISCILDFCMNKLQLIYLNKNKIDFNLNKNKEIISKLQKKIKYLSY